MENSFSVLMSVYYNDDPMFLKDALNSVFNQTLFPTEIVLVKDGPLTEELNNTIAIYVCEYPALFRNIDLPKNRGLGNALKIGLENCSHEIVIRMDSDDICYLDRFEKQVNYLNIKPNISVLGSTIEEFNKTPGDLDRYRKLPLQNEELVKFAKYRNPLNHPSVAFKKKDIQEVGSYQDMPLFEDYYLWVKMLKNGYIIENLEEPLLHYRVGNNMIGRRHGFSYFIKEFTFLKTIKKMKFIGNREFLISIILKLPLRLLPKKMLSLFYKVWLR